MLYQVNHLQHEEHYEIAERNGFKVKVKKPEALNHETKEVYEAISIFSGRQNQFSIRTPLSEVESYVRTFSTFGGTTKEFLRLFLLAEDLIIKSDDD